MRRKKPNDSPQKHHEINQPNKNKHQLISHNSPRQKQRMTPNSPRNKLIISPRLLRNTSNPQIFSNILRTTQNKTYQTKNNIDNLLSTHKKLLPLITKRILHQRFINFYFQQIRNYIKVKKILFLLLLGKPKRNLHDAFYSMRMYTLQIKNEQILAKHNQLKLPNLMCVLLCKLFKKNFQISLKKIKLKAIRKKKVLKFIQKFENCLKDFRRIRFQRTFLSRLRSFRIQIIVRNKYLDKINLLSKRSRSRILSFCFNKLVNYSQFVGYELRLEQWTVKSTQMIRLYELSKCLINEEKQKLKRLKFQFDSLKLQRNRQLNQLKKSRARIKQETSIDIRSQLQDQVTFIEELKRTQIQLQKYRQQLNLRQQRKSNAEKQDFVNKLIKLYERIENQSQQMQVSQQVVLFDILEEKQLEKFQSQSPEYYFRINSELIALIHNYENLKLTQVDFQYLDKLQENKILKTILITVVKRQIEKIIYGPINTSSKEISKEPFYYPIKSQTNNMEELQMIEDSLTVKEVSQLQDVKQVSQLSGNSIRKPLKPQEKRRAIKASRVVGKISNRVGQFTN